MSETNNINTNAEKIASWRWRRTKANMSLEDMAIAANKKVPEISKYETGKTEPKATTIDKIESVLTARGV